MSFLKSCLYLIRLLVIRILYLQGEKETKGNNVDEADDGIRKEILENITLT
jgi:hypothetical protein